MARKRRNRSFSLTPERFGKIAFLAVAAYVGWGFLRKQQARAEVLTQGATDFTGGSSTI